MKNRKGFTMVEVIISFVLILVVMIYLLRTIIEVGNKNSELLTYQEFSVYENNLLDNIYKDVDEVYDITEDFIGISKCADCGDIEENNVDLIDTILFNDINKKIILNRNDRTITYDDKIYQLPDDVKFREDTRMYEITSNQLMHDYWVLTIKLTVREKDEDIKIVYQNKYSNNVHIVFDANGGTPAMTPMSRKMGETLGTLPTVTYVDHDFAGWYTERETGNKISSETIPEETSVTYYAHWVSQTYVINYYDGDTKLGESNHERNVAKNLETISSLGGSRSGWSFYGWTAGTNDTERTYTNGQSVVNLPSTNGVLNLYAIWVRDANFYSGISKARTTTSPQYYNPKGNKYRLRPPASLDDTATIDTFSKNGWRTDTNAAAKMYALRGTDITSDKKDYYLIYARTLILNYNGNGETSGTVERQTGVQYYNTNGAKSNVTFTLRKNSFKKTGYNFSSWDLGAPGSKYTFSPLPTEGRSTTARAQWTSKTVVTTFYRNYNNDDNTKTSKTYTYGTSNQSFTDNNWGRTGYTLTGWSENRNGSGTNYSTNAEVKDSWINSHSPSISLYAVWTPNTYTITYNGNGGTWNGLTSWEDTTRGPATFGKNYKTFNQFFMRDGYTFVGWNEKADGTGVDWTDRINTNWQWSYNKNVTLYAQWIPNSMTIRYYAGNAEKNNNGNISNQLLTTQTVYYDGTDFATYGLPNYDGGTWSLTRTGYNPSKYWDVNAEGSSITIDEDHAYATTQSLARAMSKLNAFKAGNINVDIYAGWNPKTLLATFKANGATSGTDNQTQTFTYDEPDQKFSDKGLSRSGYTQIGWSTNPNATSATWSTNSGVSNEWILQYAPSITLYAVWTQNPTIRTVYHINYDNDSTVYQYFTIGGQNQKFGYYNGSPIWGTSGQFGGWDRQGYTLLGWAKSSTATSALYTPYNEVGDGWINNVYNNVDGTTPNQTIHLYAVWTPKKIQVDLSQYGTTTGSDPRTFYFYYGINKIYKDAACTQQITKIVTPTKQDYTFDQYWGDGSSGGGYKERYIYSDGTFSDDLVTDIYKNATFQPEWILNNSGGGGGSGGGSVTPGCVVTDYTIYSPQECGNNGWTCTQVQGGYRSIDFGCADVSYRSNFYSRYNVPTGYWVAQDCSSSGCSSSSQYYFYGNPSRFKYTKKVCTQYNSFAGYNNNYSVGFMWRCN